MKLSARNIFKGKVLEVSEGVITAKVKLDIGNGNIITAIVSKEAVQDLGIKVGDQASAIIKATEVLLGK